MCVFTNVLKHCSLVRVHAQSPSSAGHFSSRGLYAVNHGVRAPFRWTIILKTSTKI